MNLDPVESGFFRVGGCPPIISQGLFDSAGRQGNRLRNLYRTRGNERPAIGTDRRWSNGLRVVRQQGRMGDSADMPQLKEDSAFILMNGVDDSAPRFHLFGGMNPWSIDVAFAHRRDL